MVESIPYLRYGISTKLVVVIGQSSDDRIQTIGYFLMGLRHLWICISLNLPSIEVLDLILTNVLVVNWFETKHVQPFAPLQLQVFHCTTTGSVPQTLPNYGCRFPLSIWPENMEFTCSPEIIGAGFEMACTVFPVNGTGSASLNPDAMWPVYPIFGHTLS